MCYARSCKLSQIECETKLVSIKVINKWQVDKKCDVALLHPVGSLVSGHFLSYPQEEVGLYSFHSKHPDYIFICLFRVLKGEGGGSLWPSYTTIEFTPKYTFKLQGGQQLVSWYDEPSWMAIKRSSQTCRSYNNEESF